MNAFSHLNGWFLSHVQLNRLCPALHDHEGIPGGAAGGQHKHRVACLTGLPVIKTISDVQSKQKSWYHTLMPLLVLVLPSKVTVGKTIMFPIPQSSPKVWDPPLPVITDSPSKVPKKNDHKMADETKSTCWDLSFFRKSTGFEDHFSACELGHLTKIVLLYHVGLSENRMQQ